MKDETKQNLQKVIQKNFNPAKGQDSKILVDSINESFDYTDDKASLSSVNSIADLRAFNVTPLKGGETVNVLSYYGDGNGGGGEFYALKYQAKANGTASIGSGVSLTVDALPEDLKAGQVLEFTGGGVFELTADVDKGDITITGDLTVANVADNEEAGLSDNGGTVIELISGGGAFRWKRTYSDVINVLEFGVRRGSEHDDDNATIIDVISEISGDKEVVFPYGEAFYSSSSHSFPDGTILKMHSKLIYTGIPTGTFIEVGTGSDQQLEGSIFNISTTTRSDYSDDTYVGLKISGLVDSFVKITGVKDFHTNVLFESKFSYNRVDVGKIENGSIGILIKAQNTFIAESLFLGGRFSFSFGAAFSNVVRTGVKVDRSAYGGGGNNFTFLSQSFEIFNSVAVDDSCCYWVNDIEYVRAYNFRFEGSGNTGAIYAARFSGEAQYNYMEVGRGKASVLNESVFSSNIVVRDQEIGEERLSLIKNLDSIGSKISNYSTTTKEPRWALSGGLCAVNFFGTNSIGFVNQGLRINRNGVSPEGVWAVGGLFEVTGKSQVIVTVDWDGVNEWGRLVVRPYDSDGNVIVDAGTIKGTSNDTVAFTNNWWTSNTDKADHKSKFKIDDDSVKKIFIGFSGQNPNHQTFVHSFNVYAESNKLYPDPEYSENKPFLATSIPSSGYYQRGHTIFNDNTLGAGDDIQWVCVKEGGKFGEVRSNDLALTSRDMLGYCLQYSDSSIWALCGEGTLASSEPDISTTEIGDIITDGTALLVKIADQEAEFKAVGTY